MFFDDNSYDKNSGNNSNNNNDHNNNDSNSNSSKIFSYARTLIESIFFISVYTCTQLFLIKGLFSLCDN